MDALSLLRTLGALGLVLGLLTGALWMVRRYDIRLPGRVGAGSERRLQLVERLSIDGRRSVALLSRDGHEHLILLAPEGNMVIESDIAPRRRRAIKTEPAAAPPAPVPDFAAMVERAGRVVRQGIEAGSRRVARSRGTSAAAPSNDAGTNPTDA